MSVVEEVDRPSVDSELFNAAMAAFCVLCAGLGAGLTMGMLSLDITKLEIKAINGTEAERDAASKILPLVKQHHLLLVTLLLFDSLASETLPIFLDELVPSYMAVAISVCLMLIFGEIIPSAIFTGPAQLQTAASLVKLVQLLMSLFYPITYPISKILDHVFGVEEHSSSITRSDMETMIKMQRSGGYQALADSDDNPNSSSSSGNKPTGKSSSKSNKIGNEDTDDDDDDDNEDDEEELEGLHTITDVDIDVDVELGMTGNNTHTHHADPHNQTHHPYKGAAHSTEEKHGGSLNTHEVNLMLGVLNLSKLNIRDCMLTMDRVYSISSKMRLDSTGLTEILQSGFSRIPVYFKQKRSSVVGYMLVKELIVVR